MVEDANRRILPFRRPRLTRKVLTDMNPSKDMPVLKGVLEKMGIVTDLVMGELHLRTAILRQRLSKLPRNQDLVDSNRLAVASWSDEELTERINKCADGDLEEYPELWQAILDEIEERAKEAK